MYISLIVSISSNLTHLHSFSAAAIVHGNQFFRLYLNLLNLKESSRKLVIVSVGFSKLSNLHMHLKQKSSALLRNFTLRTFGILLIVFSTKVNLLYLLDSTNWKFCLLHLIKENYLLKTVRTQILMTQVTLYPFSPLELRLSITEKLRKMPQCNYILIKLEVTHISSLPTVCQIDARGSVGLAL